MTKILFAFLFLSQYVSLAQLRKIKTIESSEIISTASVDRPGDLYLTSVTGQFQKFDKDGAVQLIHKNNPAPDLFEPRDGARLFAFYRSLRQYAYLDPKFDFLTTYQIDSALVIDPWLICSSGEFNVWVIDSADASLHKVNTKLETVEIDIKLESSIKAIDVTYMREYQGFLFMLAKDGEILIFNSIGKSIKKLKAPGIKTFNFLGEELYYTVGDLIIFFDLFSAETREMKLPTSCKFALLTDERLYLVQEKSVDLFLFKP